MATTIPTGRVDHLDVAWGIYIRYVHIIIRRTRTGQAGRGVARPVPIIEQSTKGAKPNDAAPLSLPILRGRLETALRTAADTNGARGNLIGTHP